MTAPDPVAMAVRLIRQCEGCRLAPYQDSTGIWTIGIGSIRLDDGSPVCATTPTISQEQADAMMMRELAGIVSRVDAAVPANATPAQRAACYSFAYNEGVGAFLGSTLLRKWKAGDVAGAAEQFGAWIYAGGKVVQGLVNRRRLERAVWEGRTSV